MPQALQPFSLLLHTELLSTSHLLIFDTDVPQALQPFSLLLHTELLSTSHLLIFDTDVPQALQPGVAQHLQGRIELAFF